METDAITDTAPMPPAPVLFCQLPKHADGVNGCVAVEPASWIIQIIHASEDHPTFLFVCSGFIAWVKARWDWTLLCLICGAQETPDKWIRIVGPIEGRSA